MPGSVYYVQPCPACGRSLQVRVDYLGKAIACQHCHAHFVAQQEQDSVSPTESGLALLDRADELLKALEKRRQEMAAQTEGKVASEEAKQTA